MNGGSFFLAEIRRMMSSLSPLGTDSDSMSVTKPHLYSRLASSSIVLLSVVMISTSYGRLLAHHRERDAPRRLVKSGGQALAQQLNDPALVAEQVGDRDAVEGAAHPVFQRLPERLEG